MEYLGECLTARTELSLNHDEAAEPAFRRALRHQPQRVILEEDHPSRCSAAHVHES